MRLLRHPAFEEITTLAADDKVDEHLTAGWVPVLTDEQQERFDELELEAELAGPVDDE